MQSNRWVGFLFAALLASTVITAARQNPPVNDDARILQDFKMRLDKYLEIRKSAEKDAPALKTTKEPEKIKLAQRELAARIRGLRTNAKAGDIFTPEIQAKFRRLLSPELKGEDGQDAKKVVKDDAPTAVPMKVNADYPDGKSFPSVPTNLLQSLPTLPEQVEYRIIDKHLILRDNDANIIIDFILNAIR